MDNNLNSLKSKKSRYYDIIPAILIWCLSFSIFGALLLGSIMISITGDDISEYLGFPVWIIFIIGVISLVLLIFLGFQLYRGRKWAKILSLVLFSLLLLFSLYTLIKNGTTNILSLLFSLLGIYFIITSLIKSR